MINVGIDLGTTFSIIGTVNVHGFPALFPDSNDASEFRTPSVALIDADACYIGRTVEDKLDEEPDLPALRFVKLRMGKESSVFVDRAGRSWSPEAVSALILRKLLRDAEAFSGEEIGGAVITLPAQFQDPQRRAVRNAAALAGIAQLRLIEEPVAAAIYYGVAEHKNDRTIFVYDLGGGTFDATILHCSTQGLYVLATEGSASLGGKNFDEAIMRAVVGNLPQKEMEALLSDPATSLQLRRFAEQAKIKLCKPGIGQVRQTLLLGHKVVDTLLTRNQFDALIAPFIEETAAACERCLSGAGLSWSSIDDLLLVGGSTLMPAVHQRVREMWGKTGARPVSRQPHQAVAFGAALIASQNGERETVSMPRLMQRIVPSDLGIRVRDPRSGKASVKVLIPRNTPLPARHSGIYYTTRADQTRMVLEIVERKGTEERSLGRFSFGPIQHREVDHPVEITIAYNEEGIVKVNARDPQNGQEMEHVIENEADSETSKLMRERELVMSRVIV